MSFYVTTPIYYVNGEPHLGHAYSTMAADVLARHQRRLGEDVFFLTGTDEHGEPVAQAAENEGIEPQELVDRNAPKFKRMGEQVDATNDFFIRTTDPGHIERVQSIISRVRDNGHVYEGTYEGWYCPRCADFKSENELGPGYTCPVHEIVLHREQEENWFFRLSSFQEPLERLYAERPDFVKPDFRRNEALAFIQRGLQDVSLSRPKLQWGVPLPWAPEQVMYVWFDALLNYYTALGYAREGAAAGESAGEGVGGGDLTGRFWPATWHIIAKDILKFHTVYWPAFLMAADIEPPRGIYVHGYLMLGEKKMSKSLGNVLDPFEVIDRFGADALRFYCFREVRFGRDGSISTAGFETRYQTELANELGNLASRTLAMIDRYRDGVVPAAENGGAGSAPPIDPAGSDGSGPAVSGSTAVRADPALAADLDGIDAQVCELLERAELTEALDVAWQGVRRLNRYVEESRPWALAKDEAAAERLDTVLYSLAEGLRVVALLLLPFLPASTEKLLRALDETGRAPAGFGSGAGGQRVEKLPPLFPKIEAVAGLE